MNRVVRENAKQGVNFVVSDSYSSLSQRDAGLYADERVRRADRSKRGLKTSGTNHRGQLGSIYSLLSIAFGIAVSLSLRRSCTAASLQ